MRAEAIIEVERRGPRSVCTRLRSDPPISLRQSPDAVLVVSSGAGPLGGDELALRVRVGAGAQLTLRSVAATVVLPGHRAGPSRSILDIEVDAGGHLELLLEPQIIAAGADHESSTTIGLADGATVRWRDEVVLGRHAEAGGSLLQRTRVVLADAPLLVTDLAVGPRWPASLGPGGIDGARALGSLFAVGEHGTLAPPATAVPGARGALMELDGRGVLAAVVAATAGAGRRWLDQVVASAAAKPGNPLVESTASRSWPAEHARSTSRCASSA